MDMTISTVKPASISALVESALNGARVTPAAEPTPILTGEAVTVEEPSSSRTTDIEKLAAQLLQESNEAREESLLSHLKSLSENDVFEKIRSKVNGEAKAAFDQMETKANDLAQVEGELEQAKTETADAETVLADAQAAKNAAEEKLRALENNPDAAEGDIAAARRELARAESAVGDAQRVVDAAAEKEAALAARVIALEDEIVALAEGLDVESYRLLSDALKAVDINQHHVDPMEDPRAEDERKEGGTVPLSERSPLEIIRDSLRRQAGDLLDSQETRRENIV